jgi:hypothetical protein
MSFYFTNISKKAKILLTCQIGFYTYLTHLLSFKVLIFYKLLSNFFLLQNYYQFGP